MRFLDRCVPAAFLELVDHSPTLGDVIGSDGQIHLELAGDKLIVGPEGITHTQTITKVYEEKITIKPVGRKANLAAQTVQPCP